MTDRTGILKNSPLTYTLAAVRFTQWALMAKNIDEIHNELREAAPILHNIQSQPIGSVNTDSLPTLSWMFLSKDRKLGIHLSSDQLLIFSSKYVRFSDFKLEADKALGALFKHMNYMDVTNIGVRYIDCIKIKDTEKFDDYITTKLLPAEIDGLDVIGGASIVTYKVGDSELRVRCVTQPDEMDIPADLIGLLSIAQGQGNVIPLKRLGGDSFLLDIDALKIYSEPERISDKQDILTLVTSLHDTANAYFRHKDICSNHAFKMWKGEEI